MLHVDVSIENEEVRILADRDGALFVKGVDELRRGGAGHFYRVYNGNIGKLDHVAYKEVCGCHASGKGAAVGKLGHAVFNNDLHTDGITVELALGILNSGRTDSIGYKTYLIGTLQLINKL